VQEKAPAIIVLLVLFGLCAAAGYWLARITEQPAERMTSTPDDTSDLSNQRRLILIQVDDLTAANPQLDVVWLVAVSMTDAPQLNFRIIYPGDKDAEVLSNFGISENRQPNPSFLPGVQQAFNLAETTQYILFDRTALQRLSIWIGTGDVPLEGRQPSEYAVFQKTLIPYGCEIARSNVEGLPQLDWAGLIGAGHLSMNFDMNEAGTILAFLRQHIKQITCDVPEN